MTVSTEAPCDVRFGQVGLACVRVRDPDPAAVCEDLERRVASAPQMFSRTAVVVDLSHLVEFPDDGTVDSILEAIRDAGMLPVGIAYGDGQTEALAQRMGLPLIARFREALERQATAGVGKPAPAEKRVEVEPAPVEPEADTVSHAGLQRMESVRSGQQIYARERDLIVAAGVANGAEVIADGSIHVYGSLRGRAFAGAQGDETARIFCTDFRPQLVSIAGHYRVFESLPEEFEGQAVQCWLEGNKLIMDRL